MNGQILRGSVVSFPDPFEKHEKRSGVVVVEPHLNDPRLHTVGPLTTDPSWEEHKLAVRIDKDDTIKGKLDQDSFFEPWRTTPIQEKHIDGPYARLSKDAMKKIAKSYVKMSYEGYNP